MGNLRRTRYCGEVRLPDAGQEMVVAGSIAKCRDKGGIIFADLRDTTGILQLVFDDGTPAEVFSQVQKVKALGLDVPPMAELAMRLNAGGLRLPDGILTVADMVKELKKALCPSK